MGRAQYTTDYYVNFVASPSDLLTGGLTDWLERAGPVPVVSTGATVRADLVLDGSVTKLVIDRTDRMRPQAVITARFFVTRDTGGGSPIVSDTAYTGRRARVARHPPPATPTVGVAPGGRCCSAWPTTCGRRSVAGRRWPWCAGARC